MQLYIYLDLALHVAVAICALLALRHLARAADALERIAERLELDARVRNSV